MTPDLRRIEYRRGMLEAVGKVDALPIKTWSPAAIPDDVRAAIRKEGIPESPGSLRDIKSGDFVSVELRPENARPLAAKITRILIEP